jgi:TonB family protein
VIAALAAAIALHGQVAGGLWIWERLHPPETANEVDVEYVPASEADLKKEDLPPERIELPPPPGELARVHTPSEKKPKTPEAAKLPETKPEEKKAVAVPPPPPQPPAPQPAPPKSHMKMVEQQYEKDEADNPNAHFLGEKNKHVQEETRARDTNLERESKGGEQSSPNANQLPEVGDKDRKIAEIEDKKSELGKKAPHVTPHVQQELPEAKADKSQKSLLSMRNLEPRQHDNIPENNLPRSDEGMQPLPEHGGAPMARDQQGHKLGKGKQLRLNLTGEDYDRIYGKTEGAEREMAETERSHRPGKWEKRWGQIKSALENFIPEVKPGNQTALGTRAAPFAAYIARMHRGIHKLWGFGVLEDWDRKSSSSPFNNMEMWTMIEIVLNGDGTIDKLTVARPSGYLPFDVAAMDVVMSAGPYPDPPAGIKSGNGKIYLHWRFHRDDRACGTFGVDPYILGTPPEDTVHGDMSEVPKSAVHPEGPMAGSGGLGGLGPSPGAVPSVPRPAPRVLGRSGGRRKYDDEASPEPDPVHGARAAARMVNASDPEARRAAEAWFTAYRRADAAALAAASALPFRSGGGVVAKTAGELAKVYKDLLAEAPARREVQSVQVYSASSVRGARGGLPSSGEDGAGQLFAVGRAGSEEFVLVLARSGSGWKVLAIDR